MAGDVKEGRPRNLNSPEELWKLFEEYKEDLIVQAEKWKKVQYVGKEGERVEDAPTMPMILKGFYTFCHYRLGCVRQYFKNESENYIEFLPITTRIRDEIEANQVSGALLGNFNPNLTARLNGIKEQTETITTSINILNIDPLDDSADNGIKEDSKS